MKDLKFKDFAWFIFDKPNHEELEEIFKKYEIDNIEVSSILEQDSRAKLDVYKDYNYLKLNFLKYFKKNDVLEINEMHNIYGKDFIITISTYPSRKVSQIVEKYKHRETELENIGITDLLFDIIDNQISKGTRIVDYIEKEVNHLEKESYNNLTKDVIFSLSKKRKNLVVFKHTSNINLAVLETLAKSLGKKDTDELQIDFDNLVDKAHKTSQEISILEESVTGINDTVNSLFEVNTNDIIKKFTIISFIFIPMNLIAGIFGMNAENVPFHNGTIIVSFIGMFLFIGIGLFLFRKYLFK